MSSWLPPACPVLPTPPAQAASSQSAFQQAVAEEQQARGRLLAGQHRMAEALHIGAALSQHLCEVAGAAAVAPQFGADRAALAVRQAEAQVQEAHKVLVLAQCEVG